MNVTRSILDPITGALLACEPCPLGSYMLDAARGLCSDTCAVGNFSEPTCAPGTVWQPQGCVPCAGIWADSQCQCPAGKYYNQSQNLCLGCRSVCPPNSRLSAECPQGSTVDTTICFCNPNFYGAPDQGVACTQCTKDCGNCAAGQYYDASLLQCVGCRTSCTEGELQGTCLKGSMTDVTMCTCARGFYDNAPIAAQDAHGTLRDVGQCTACKACPSSSSFMQEGTACPGGVGRIDTVVCTCLAGFTKDALGACIACAAGFFASQSGSTTCEPCPSGFFVEASQSSSCSACKRGTYTAGNGSTSCDLCNVGSFASQLGSTFCEACAAGSFVTASGSSSCSACGRGTYMAGNGSAACDFCRAGSFARWLNSTACEACAVGSFTTAAASSSCSTCARGTYTAGSGSTSCDLCGAGSFARRLGSTACEACAVGSFATASGSSSCLACARGTFASGNGSTACSVCEAGTGTQQEGQSACTPCVSGVSFSRTSGQCSLCSQCAKGQYVSVACNTTADTVCAACTVCSAGQYSVRGCTGSADATCARCTRCAVELFPCGPTYDAVCSSL